MRAPFLFVVCLTLIAGLASSGKGADVRGVITGHASFYGEEYRGRVTASGVPFDPDAMTAASWDYPLGTRVRVTHGAKAIVVVITDRGPAWRLRQRGRVLDLSEAAFARLAPLSVGLIEVSAVIE